MRLHDETFPLIDTEMPRAEFERKVRENPRNDHLRREVEQAAPEQTPTGEPAIIEPVDLDAIDADLLDVLAWDDGLLGMTDKEVLSNHFRNGESDESIARMLADTFSGQSATMTLQTGEDADYFTSPNGIEFEIKGNHFYPHSSYTWSEIVPVLRTLYGQERYGFLRDPLPAPLPEQKAEPTIEIAPEPEPAARENVPARNFRITDEYLGHGDQKAKYAANIAAIQTLHTVQSEHRNATPEEQEVLSRYVGWGGLPEAFDPDKTAWAKEYKELKDLLTPEEYDLARGSTLNAHYTSPTVIRAMYQALANMGFTTGNILEPSCGVGNFFGMLPQSMQNSRLYGVELDSITGNIAKRLYPKADIKVAGFKTTDHRDFYDVAIGNVPFGNYRVNDKAYNKLGFTIHNYFFAKALDQVRPGGVVAFVVSRYLMDAKSPKVRSYLAQRAELLGAIRLPNNAFKDNANTEVVTDILFLQKREQPIVDEPDWVHLGQTEDGFTINSYFVDHPDMVLGHPTAENTRYGKEEYTVEAIEGTDLREQLEYAIQNVTGRYEEAALPELSVEDADESVPADPHVKNFSYTLVDGRVYFRENSRMNLVEASATALSRIRGLVELRDCVQRLIDYQMDNASDATIQEEQNKLNALYDTFTAKYSLINSRANEQAFSDDSSYFLLCSLEILDKDGNLERKADMFTKRTIRRPEPVTHVDTASEALALSLNEYGSVNIDYMADLTGKSAEQIESELQGVLYRNTDFLTMEQAANGDFQLEELPFVTADEYLSGNVRQKLAVAKAAQAAVPGLLDANVEALEKVQPKDLTANEINVRLGAPWVPKKVIEQFMYHLLETPFYCQHKIRLQYTKITGEWTALNKTYDRRNVRATSTYGTDRASAYRLLEDALNQRSTKIFDYVEDDNGNEWPFSTRTPPPLLSKSRT